MTFTSNRVSLAIELHRREARRIDALGHMDPKTIGNIRPCGLQLRLVRNTYSSLFLLIRRQQIVLFYGPTKWTVDLRVAMYRLAYQHLYQHSSSLCIRKISTSLITVVLAYPHVQYFEQVSGHGFARTSVLYSLKVARGNFSGALLTSSQLMFSVGNF